MKKLLLVLLTCVMMITVAGCGEASLAASQTSVEGFLTSLKDNDYEKMKSYIAEGDYSFDDLADEETIEMFNILFSHLEYNIVTSRETNEGEVEVEVTIKAKDLEKALSNYVVEALRFAFGEALTSDYTDEEMDAKLVQIFSDVVASDDVETLTNNVNIKVIKQNDKWLVNIDEQLFDSLVGDMSEISEQLENSLGN